MSHEIKIIDDLLYEGNETFVVQVRKQNQETTVTMARCVITIQDDDCK